MMSSSPSAQCCSSTTVKLRSARIVMARLPSDTAAPMFERADFIENPARTHSLEDSGVALNSAASGALRVRRDQASSTTAAGTSRPGSPHHRVEHARGVLDEIRALEQWGGHCAR